MSDKIVTLTFENYNIADGGWDVPYKATYEDGDFSYAACAPGQITDMLIGRVSADQLPAEAVLEGMVVRIKKKQRGGTTGIPDYRVSFLNEYIIIGDNKANPANWPTVLTFYTYGSAIDTWATGFTGNDFNTGNIGIGIQAHKPGGILSVFFDIDYIELTIYYSGGVIPPTGNPYGPRVQVI